MFIIANLVNQVYHLQTSKANKYRKVHSSKMPSFLNEDVLIVLSPKKKEKSGGMVI